MPRQESLARAFGQVEHEAVVAPASGWATSDIPAMVKRNRPMVAGIGFALQEQG